MTALLRTAAGCEDIVVVCDQCGNSLQASGTSLRDFPIVWNAVVQLGWTGASRPIGPHFCDACAVADIPSGRS